MAEATSTSVSVQNRISKIYQSLAYYLKGTTAETAFNTYNQLADPSRDDLSTLKNSLNNYKNSLSENQVTLFAAVNNLLMVVEIVYMLQEDGVTTLNSNFNKEHVNGLTFSNIATIISGSIAGKTTVEDYATAIANSVGGAAATDTATMITTLTTAMNAGTAKDNIPAAVTALTNALSGQTTAAGIAATIYDGIFIVDSDPVAHTDRTVAQNDLNTYSNSDLFVTTSSAIGTGDISAVANDDDTLTGVIGNTALNSYTMLSVLTSVGSSISEQLTNFIAAVEARMGNTAIAPSAALTVKSCSCTGKNGNKCTVNEIPIYTTANALSTTMNAFQACAKWADSGVDLYITPTGLVGNCSGLLNEGQALAKCLHYTSEHP